MLIGTNMKAIRQSAGKTLKDLSDETGISVQDLSAFERNHRHPSPSQMFSIATALNKTIADLLGENERYAGMDTCAYCGVQYHPMTRYSNGKRVICVCDPLFREIARLGDDPGCQEQAEAEGFYARPDLTPSR